MRVGINAFALSERLGMAGSGRYILELIRALVKLDHGHELILFGNADNWHLLPSNGSRRVDCGRVTTVRPLRLLWEQFALPLALQRYQIDILHSPVFVAPLWVPCASVVTILDMTWFSLPGQHTRVKGTYFRAMIPPTARRAVRIIAISEASKRDVVTVLGVPAERVAVTYLGVDQGVFSPSTAKGWTGELEARYGVRQPYVLYVGKLEPRKNLPTLIKAFASIAQQFPDHQLVIAGNLGWGYQAIYETAARITYGGRVQFTGFVSEANLPALYAGADLFVYPSSYEGFGIPVLEAMACGVPVVTSNVSSLPEVVGDCGLLVDPLSVEELISAMKVLLKNQALRENLRERGLARSRQFTWEETARKTLRVYEDAYSLAKK